MHYHVGIDGISLWLVMLTTFIMPLAILSTWTAVEEKVKEYMICLLLLEVGMLGAFISLDLFLFYIFWELMLIPMYFIIGIWGGKTEDLRGSQVLHLYHGRLAAHAGRSDLPVLLGIKAGFRLSASWSLLPETRPGHPDLAVPCLCTLLRHQGPHVPAPHLVAACPYRGSDRRIGDPGRHHAENGNLRLCQIRHAALP